ncbi:MAG: YihY family inner membrane protein [Sedimentisphaerales bacterium]|nr:YihY family inner membrane protein [Sedimentisphaerales bacterium]
MFEEIMQTPCGQFGKIGRFIVFQIKLWIHSYRLLKKNQAGLQAAAMSYYTVFGLVPLAVVMLMFFQFFPSYKNTGTNIKTAVYEQLNLSNIEYPDAAGNVIRLTDHIDGIIEVFFAGFSKATAAVLCLALVILASLMALSTIEKAFNHIWGISRERGMLQRMVNYWGLLTLVPLLTFTAIAVATSCSRVGAGERSFISNILPPVVSYIVASACFCVMYLILPNTKVGVRSAIWGSTMAALMWMFSRCVFKLYINGYMHYSPIYGLLGLVSVGVFWLYLSWCIVLFGMQLTYTSQNLHKLDAAEIAAATRRHDEFFIASELTIMNIVGEIASAFEGGGGMVEPAVISGKLNIPIEFVNKILGHLVTAGLLVRVSEPKDGFMPARDPGSMKLADIIDAVRKAGFAQSPEEQSMGLQEVARLQREALSQFTVKQLLGIGPDEDAVPKNIPVANPEDFYAANPPAISDAKPQDVFIKKPQDISVPKPQDVSAAKKLIPTIKKSRFPSLIKPHDPSGTKPQDFSSEEPHSVLTEETQTTTATETQSDPPTE